MKNFIHQFLMLGGFYFIISFICSLFDSNLLNIAVGCLFFLLVVMLVILCFKRHFIFLQKIQDKYMRINYYLIALGVVEYFIILFSMVPGVVYGYYATQAQYNDVLYISKILEYLEILSYVSWAVTIVALLWATYKSFVKKEG